MTVKQKAVGTKKAKKQTFVEKYGAIDLTGKEVIPPKYASAAIKANF
jgi:hypothetical protein